MLARPRAGRWADQGDGPRRPREPKAGATSGGPERGADLERSGREERRISGVGTSVPRDGFAGPRPSQVLRPARNRVARNARDDAPAWNGSGRFDGPGQDRIGPRFRAWPRPAIDLPPERGPPVSKQQRSRAGGWGAGGG